MIKDADVYTACCELAIRSFSPDRLIGFLREKKHEVVIFPEYIPELAEKGVSGEDFPRGVGISVIVLLEHHLKTLQAKEAVYEQLKAVWERAHKTREVFT